MSRSFALRLKYGASHASSSSPWALMAWRRRASKLPCHGLPRMFRRTHLPVAKQSSPEMYEPTIAAATPRAP
jgi:hypothetical protein